MVKNPLYRGLRRYKSSRGVIERPVPAIVDTQTWERAQQQLAKNKALPKHGTMDAQLRGLIQCGVCGRGYVTAHNSKGSRFYRCGTTTVPRQHIAQGTCYGKSVLAEKLEDAVWKAVRELIEHPDRFLERAYQQLQTRIAQQPEQEVERQVLEVQVQAAEEKKNRLLKAYQKGWLNIEDTEAKLTEVETELKHFTLNNTFAKMRSLERASVVDLSWSCRPPRRQLSTYEEALHGHVSTLPRPPTPCDGDDPAPIESDGVGHPGDVWTGHDAGQLSLGRPRRQLPYRPALVLPGAPVGDAVVGVLASACLPSRCSLPPGGR
jgi:uncharacterized protein YecT (DUF1311 family)